MNADNFTANLDTISAHFSIPHGGVEISYGEKDALDMDKVPQDCDGLVDDVAVHVSAVIVDPADGELFLSTRPITLKMNIRWAMLRLGE